MTPLELVGSDPSPGEGLFWPTPSPLASILAQTWGYIWHARRGRHLPSTELSNRLSLLIREADHLLLYQLLYASEVAQGGFSGGFPTGRELVALHQDAQRRNEEIHVTGILLYNAGHFLQLLEGKAIVVRRLFEKIRSDRRHQNVQQLAFLPVEARMFQGWNMGMLNLDERSDLDSSLFRDFRHDAERATNSIEAQRRSLELLKDFKRHLGSPPACRSADGLER